MGGLGDVLGGVLGGGDDQQQGGAGGFDVGSVLGGILGGASGGGGGAATGGDAGGGIDIGSVLGGLTGGSGGQGGGLDLGKLAALIGPLLGMLKGGGLGNVLGQLTGGGLGDQASSWVAPGDNQAVDPQSLAQAVGPQELETLAAQSGLTVDETAQGLSELLPGMVDKLTPGGQVPDSGQLDGVLDGVLGQITDALGR